MSKRVTPSRRSKKSAHSANVEVTMVPELATTCVFDLPHVPNDEIVGFCTVAAPIGDVADFYEEKYRWTCDQAYAHGSVPEGCQNLNIALDESLHAGSHLMANRPPWPLNMPIAALVIDLAMGQIQPVDDQPYVAIRRGTSGASPAATELRRSLRTWPATASTI